MIQKNEAITSTITVKEVLDRYPKSRQTFVDIGLLCIGCPTEAFHTLKDVAREYDLDLNYLIHRIKNAIGNDTE